MDNTKRFGLPPISETLNMSKRSRRELLKEAIEHAVGNRMEGNSIKQLSPFLNSIDLFVDLQSTDWRKGFKPTPVADPYNLEALFLEKISPDTDRSGYFLLVHPSSIGATVLIYKRGIHDAPFERLDVVDGNPIILTILGLCAGLKTQIKNEKLRYPEPSPYWVYHPERIRSAMPHVHDLMDNGHQANWNAAWRKSVEHHYVKWIKQKIVRTSDALITMLGYIELENIYRYFHVYGRHIYRIDENLSSMFIYSDIDDVPFDQICAPHKAFYLHFGAHHNLTNNDGLAFEGAYIVSNEKGLSINIVFDGSGNIDGTEWINNAEPFVNVRLYGANTLGEGIDFEEKQFEECMSVMREYAKDDRTKRTVWQSENARPLNSQSLVALGDMRDSFKHHLRDALRLIINSILYISAYADAVEAEIPVEAAARTKEAVQSSDAGKREKALAKLKANGFVVINHVRSTATAGASEQTQHNASRRAHWRRGFWRMQRFGKGFSDARLTWIRPTIVSGHNDWVEPRGVIHKVS